MPTRDDELTRKLRSAVRPVAEPDFHTMVEMKSRHDRKRRIERGVLAVAVLAGFGLVVFALSRASVGTGPATQSPIPSVGAIANGKIVFVRQIRGIGGELLTASPDGTKHVLTHGFNDASPAVSPNGRTVAFSRTSPFNETNLVIGTALYTVPIDGGTPSSLLDPSWFAADPAWSPDGTRIAFAGGGPSGATGIYVMSADGSSPPRIVYAGKTDLAAEAHPSWSPDGTKLVFQEGNAALSDPQNFQLYAVSVDSSGPAVGIVPDAGTSMIDPAWSPDGKSVVCSLRFAATGGRIVILPVDSFITGVEDLTQGFYVDVDPTWSPDGRFIAFARQAHGSWEIDTIQLDGGGAGSITRISEGEDPAWQPVPG
jgi:Tol biopolymer transport system component